MKARTKVTVTIAGRKYAPGSLIEVSKADEWLIDQGLAVVEIPKKKVS